MAFKPHFFPICQPVKYESNRERLGIALMQAEIVAGRVGRGLTRPIVLLPRRAATTRKH